MARDPFDVINDILTHIPIEGENLHFCPLTALRKELETIRDDSAYLPPEYKYPAWLSLTQALERTLHIPPIHEWEKKIQDIMKNRPITEQRNAT